jgi:hypothetical protein
MYAPEVDNIINVKNDEMASGPCHRMKLEQILKTI